MKPEIQKLIADAAGVGQTKRSHKTTHHVFPTHANFKYQTEGYFEKATFRVQSTTTTPSLSRTNQARQTLDGKKNTSSTTPKMHTSCSLALISRYTIYSLLGLRVPP